MKIEIDSKFMERNTEAGFLRFLSSRGFDVNEPYEVIRASSKTKYVVSGEDMPGYVAPVEDEKPKKRSQPVKRVKRKIKRF